MKKQNNRFHGNGNSGYTLNYKFDSVSIAGKVNGTALDLIRRYNDLAKEAQGCGDYVNMEIYRQYAEHYRKIVTEINERRQQQRADFQNKSEEKAAADNVNTPENDEKGEITDNEPVTPIPEANGYVETLPASEKPKQKTFQVVEIDEEKTATEAKPKRIIRRRTAAKKETAEN